MDTTPPIGPHPAASSEAEESEALRRIRQAIAADEMLAARLRLPPDPRSLVIIAGI